MKDITVINFDGIDLEIPLDFVDSFPKEYTYETFPTKYCGPGDGLGEKLIPDYAFRWTRLFSFIGLDYSIKFSPACWIHDEDWWFAYPSWSAFRNTNCRFQRNMDSIIHSKGRNKWVKARALYRSVTYRNAVTLHGAKVFWTIKAGQGCILPDKLLRFVNNNRSKRIYNDIEKGILPELIIQRTFIEDKN